MIFDYTVKPVHKSEKVRNNKKPEPFTYTNKKPTQTTGMKFSEVLERAANGEYNLDDEIRNLGIKDYSDIDKANRGWYIELEPNTYLSFDMNKTTNPDEAAIFETKDDAIAHLHGIGRKLYKSATVKQFSKGKSVEFTPEEIATIKKAIELGSNYDQVNVLRATRGLKNFELTDYTYLNKKQAVALSLLCTIYGQEIASKQKITPTEKADYYNCYNVINQLLRKDLLAATSCNWILGTLTTLGASAIAKFTHDAIKAFLISRNANAGLYNNPVTGKAANVATSISAAGAALTVGLLLTAGLRNKLSSEKPLNKLKLSDVDAKEIMNEIEATSAIGFDEIDKIALEFQMPYFYSRNNIKRLSDDLSEVKSKTKLPDGTFTKSAKEIKDIILKYARDKTHAVRMINFYINRAGDNLPNKKEVMKAKDLIEQS